MTSRLEAELHRAWRPLHTMPSVVAFLRDDRVGGEYGVGWREKLELLQAFRHNTRRVETLSTVTEHMELAAAILRTPRATPGDVVECGCYVGGSTVNLSLACRLAGRRLVVCDSFQGLPEPAAYDRFHLNASTGHVDEYYAGRFAASEQLVRDNLARYGDLASCDLVPGFYDETLADLDRDVAVAFLDVDLIDSLKPCLAALWPRLQPGGRIYVHEARSLPLVSLFFDRAWWREHLGEDAPGFVGGGCGLPLASAWGSELGYAERPLAAVPAAA
jgi:predicted O-methyltransferase YrrM